MCLSVCLSGVASQISDTSEAIAITFKTVTASVMSMHHVLIILTLTFIHGYPDLIHENNKYSIIPETVQAMSIKLTMAIVRRKVYIIVSQSDDIDQRLRSQLRLKRDKFVTLHNSDNISAMEFKLGMMVDVCMTCMLGITRSDDLDLYARSQGVSTRTKISVELSRHLRK